MILASWNVNGLRACWDKGLSDFLNTTQADAICLQETKLQAPYNPLLGLGFNTYWNFADRKGYSGTASLSRETPLEVSYGIQNPIFDTEGRVITMEYNKFYLVNCYTPNSKGSLKRFYFRIDWDEAFRTYVCELKSRKPTIICGDFNVARSYIDIYPENLRNEENPSGFLEEEREGFEQLLACGFEDAFRLLYPNKTQAYSWWSNRLYKRDEDRGWRIDYFLVDTQFKGKIVDCGMLSDIKGSDHCPIFLEVKL